MKNSKKHLKKSFKNKNKDPSKSFRNSKAKHHLSSEKQKKERYLAVCDTCNKKCDLPFKPKYDFPIYCSDCFRKLKSKDHKYQEDPWYNRNFEERTENKPKKTKKEKSQKRIEELYSGGSEKFYNSLKEKLFEILGGKVCSSCGFKDERALGFKQIYDDTFDNIRRGGFASSWHKYISDPDLARNELRIICLNCNEIRKTVSPPKESNPRKKKKRFPR